MIKYTGVQNKIEGSVNYGKWYAKAEYGETVSTEALCEEIAHSTTVTEADARALLTELKVVLRQHLQNGDVVKLDGIGLFRVGIKSALADTLDTLDDNKIKGYSIRFLPESTFTATGVNKKGNRVGFRTYKLLQGVKVKKVVDKAAAKKQDAPAQTEG